MAYGDHLIARRWLYEHHGIEVENGRVIHYQGLPEGKAVRESDLPAFAKNRRLVVVPPSEGFTPEQVVLRARSRLGEASYDLVGNNCEHLVRWAAHGESRSLQVENVALGLLAIAAGLAAALAGLLGEVVDRLAAAPGMALLILCAAGIGGLAASASLRPARRRWSHRRRAPGRRLIAVREAR